jgi:hypothetical protein
VFRLLSFFITILGFAAVVWFGVTVDLGDRTLFGHLRAIGGSDEAKQLWDGTRGKVTDLVGKDTIKGAEILKETFSPGDKDEKSAATPAKDKGPAVERAKAPASPSAKPARESASGRQLAHASGKPPAERPQPASK